jgi:probable rRNA maturation factor
VPEESGAEQRAPLSVARTVEVPELTDEAVRGAVAAALAHGDRAGLKVDIMLIDDSALCELHERFLDDPSPTDVMAFDYTEGDGDAPDPQAEIYVSVERARAVASARGVDTRAELLLYLVHGALHLCGFDDHEEGEREAMRAAEHAVLLNLS